MQKDEVSLLNSTNIIISTCKYKNIMTDIVKRIKDQIKLAESAQSHWDIARLNIEFKSLEPVVSDINKRVRPTFGKPIDDLDLYVLAGDANVAYITLYDTIIAQQDKILALEHAEKKRNRIKSSKRRIRPSETPIPTVSEHPEVSIAPNSSDSEGISIVKRTSKAPNSSDSEGYSTVKQTSNGTISSKGSQATLDAEVAKVVKQVSTKLHFKRASPLTPKKQSTPSLSGKYLVGPPDSNQPKLCFCRIFNNNVMVRVGGGWDHLSTYLNRHFGYLATSPPDSPSQSRTTTPERHSPDHSFRSEGTMRELSMSLSPESIKQFLRKQESS
ncbi:uncharacterized protein FA14DRAFT_172490 [Meira miltonrushii]|uniref:GAR domain-containing protein n=1 Tax=Meira miltonrushii TaxID=1280837 RepID=A0A316VHS3_9BASI|nr:uncharacterized protein FA14DRAFT_172490 [Meira miltonrushii]PWN35893.1 hypothetical protein FA14DRAFT_172490 [Meira miltonrushii]